MRKLKSIMLLLLIVPCMLLFTACGGTEKEAEKETYIVYGTIVMGLTDYGKTVTELNIKEGVTEINVEAFKNCINLNKVVIPKSVTKIGKGAFEGCTNLTSITLPFVGKTETDENYLGYLFGASKNYEYTYEYGRVDYVPTSLKEVILTNCTTIDKGMFSECSSLTSIVIPEGVKEIGESAFYGCNSLTSIVIPEGVKEIGETAFRFCSSLTSVTFKNPNGWEVSNYKSLSSSALSNPSTAATYLTSTYYDDYWKRG